MFILLDLWWLFQKPHFTYFWRFFDCLLLIVGFFEGTFYSFWTKIFQIFGMKWGIKSSQDARNLADDQIVNKMDHLKRLNEAVSSTTIQELVPSRLQYKFRRNEVKWLETGCSGSLMYILYDWHNCSAADISHSHIPDPHPSKSLLL